MRLRNARSRSISAENFTGEKGKGGMAVDGTGKNAARELGHGWKISPSVRIDPGETFVLANIKEPGVINHIWMTMWENEGRSSILRMYWDDEPYPSVEVPVADFFCDGWMYSPVITSQVVELLPKNGYTSRWRMPFRRSARIEIENLCDHDITVYYQVSYDLCEVDDDEAYLHATWRRANPLGSPPEFTIVDQIHGKGTYMGVYMGIQPNLGGWWGEGEVKMFIDGDKRYPTICGTGTEDYFGGAWNFDKEIKGKHQYVDFSTPYVGFHVVPRTPRDIIYEPYQRFGMYRWHLTGDDVRFDRDFRMTVQAIGAADAYTQLVDADIFAMPVWYQMHPNLSPQRSLAEHAGFHGYKSVAEYLRVGPQPIPGPLPGSRLYHR